MASRAEPEYLLALGRYAREALAVVTDDGRIRSAANQPRLLGFDGDTLEGRHLAEFAHPDDLAAVLARMEQVNAGADVGGTMLVRARHTDGRWVPLEVDVFDARQDPLINGFLIRIFHREDLTAGFDTRPSVPALPGIDSLAEALSAGVLVADVGGRVVYANRAASELFEAAPDDLHDGGWLGFLHGDDATEARSATIAALRGDAPQQATFQVWTGPDEARWVHGRFSPLAGPERPAGWVAVLTDVTAQRAAEADLAHRATHDALTGLPDRLLLRDRLEQAVARLHRADEHVAVLFMDIDGFKGVNDRLGHAAGDRVLVELGARVQRTIRPGDTAARVGGDEFVVVADDVTERAAQAIADRVTAAVSEPIEIDGTVVAVHCSVGMALARPGEHADDVLGRADQSMYRAKRARS